MKPETIIRYFPNLSEVQQEQFRQLGPLYRDWNAKINVISRQDIGNLYERHVLHSMAIAKVISFKPGTKILDAGTGGGFPGIPLAILFPETHFHLADSTAKKLHVVNEIASSTGLKNVTTEHCRIENHHGYYDFVVSRAVATLDEMVDWVWKNIITQGFNDLPNGILYLKGMEAWGHGGITMEQLGNRALRQDKYPLKELFTEPFFETKILVHLF